MSLPPNPPMPIHLLPCPFCGGPVRMEAVVGAFRSIVYGVVCRNTRNHGGSCCMEQVPSASAEAAMKRWNMRGGVPSGHL